MYLKKIWDNKIMEGQDINYLARLPIDVLWEITKDLSPDDLNHLKKAARESSILTEKLKSNDYMFRFLKRDLPEVYNDYFDNKNIANIKYWEEVTLLSNMYYICIPDKTAQTRDFEKNKSVDFCLSSFAYFMNDYHPNVTYSAFFEKWMKTLNWTNGQYYPIFTVINNPGIQVGKIGIFELIFEFYKNYYIVKYNIDSKVRVVSLLEIINYANKYYSQKDITKIINKTIIPEVLSVLSFDTHFDDDENSLYPRINQDIYRDNLYTSNFMNFLLDNGMKVTLNFIQLLVTNELTDVLDRIYPNNRSTFAKYYNLFNSTMNNIYGIFLEIQEDMIETWRWLFSHGYVMSLSLLSEIVFDTNLLQVISETNPQILVDFFDTYLNNQERYNQTLTGAGDDNDESDIISRIEILLPFYQQYGNNYNFIWFTHEYARIHKIPELIRLLTEYGYGVGETPDKTKRVTIPQKTKPAKLKLRACTFNIAYNVQLNEVQGSEAKVVQLCQQTYSKSKGMVPNRNISQCTYNAVKYLSDQQFDLIALQEYVARPWSKSYKSGVKQDLFLDVLKELSGNNNYEMIGYPNQTTQIIYDKSVLGEGELVSDQDTQYEKKRPVMAVWFKDPQLLVINVHAPHNIIIKKETERVIDSIDKLNSLYPARILVMGDFNDPGGILQSVDVLGVTCSRHSNDDKDSCCYDDFSKFGDYIFDSDNTPPSEYGVTRIVYPPTSDHYPVVLID